MDFSYDLSYSSSSFVCKSFLFLTDEEILKVEKLVNENIINNHEVKTLELPIEEAKKRDHRKLGKELGLFMMSEYGPGFPFWLPNGMTLKNTLVGFWTDIHTKHGYKFIQTPTMLNKELWETSGHWFNYKENMYTSTIDEAEFAIKPMNCPGGMLVYKNQIHYSISLPT